MSAWRAFACADVYLADAVSGGGAYEVDELGAVVDFDFYIGYIGVFGEAFNPYREICV